MALTLIQGSESVLADRAISEIIEASVGAVVSQLDSNEIELGTITDSLAPSLFGDARIVVIREIQELTQEESEEVSSYLENSDEGVHLVLWHKGGVKGKALLDKLKKANPTLVSAEAIKKDGDKAEFIRAEFARSGRKISAGAITALIDALGSDMRELAGACSQLSADVEASKTIDEKDVEKFQQGRVETTGFDVADAVLEGKVEAALISLRQALATGVDPVLIVSALASSIRTMAKVSSLPRNSNSYQAASSLGLPPWQIDKARRQLAGWSPTTLSSAVISLAECDSDIKGASADPIYALERTILAISRSHSASI
jgi:DNA polymerase-3 subunit delta